MDLGVDRRADGRAGDRLAARQHAGAGLQLAAGLAGQPLVEGALEP
jgi:hypothetical protein